MYDVELSLDEDDSLIIHCGRVAVHLWSRSDGTLSLSLQTKRECDDLQISLDPETGIVNTMISHSNINAGKVVLPYASKQ